MKALLGLLCGAISVWGATAAFEPTDGGVQFLARAREYSAAISANGVAIRVQDAEVRVEFLHSRAGRLEGADRLPGVVNYLVGRDPRSWRCGIPTYAQVRNRSLYPGVDVVFHGSEDRLEYDFIVAPGADISRIGLKISGVRSVHIDEQGDLIAGDLRQRRPLIYQERDGGREIVEGHYLLTGEREVAFVVPSYDRNRPLVIDPELVYATRLGGSNSEQITGIATDSQGNTYLSGGPVASFPTASPHQVLVTKLDPSGQKVLYATYIGGSTFEQSAGIAVDQSGNAYVTGVTSSTDFPVTPGAFHVAANQTGAFIFKLSASGDSLVYSALVEGADSAGIAVDSEGSAYITGTTQGGLPVTEGAYWTVAPVMTGPFQVGDAFVLKLNPRGASLSYATYANERGEEQFAVLGGLGTSIAVDSSGDAYITGPGYVLKFNAMGSGLVYSVSLGDIVAYGPGFEYVGTAIALDPQKNAYVTGTTNLGHAFVMKLDVNGAPYFNAGYITLAGESSDSPQGIAADSAGNIFVAGNTSSMNFPLRSPVQEAFTQQTGFLAELDGSGNLLFSTYVGDTDQFQVVGLALDATGKPVFCGNTNNAAYVAKYDTSGISALRLDSVLNLASQLRVPVSPGELVAINGAGFGADMQLYFDSLPATMIPGSKIPTAIVPYALAGKTVTVAHVESGGQSSNDVQVPVVPAAPGIFTLNGSGTGQALAFNQDGAPNSSAHPAVVGSVVTFFATGAGQTVPPGVDGVLHRSAPAPTVLPFAVYINGIDTSGFQFGVGPAAGFQADVLKVQATVPTRGFPAIGFPLVAVSLTMKENDINTQDAVTIWIAQ